MFSPNCAIVLPSPEIAIKGSQVRAFMEKRLKKNMGLYLKHFDLPRAKMVSSAGRIMIYSGEPRKVVSALENCFGINGLFLAQEQNFDSLEGLCQQGTEICKGVLGKGTFAVRGKSFSGAFSSKKLEEELGHRLLEEFPALKVKLREPEQEVFCVAFKEAAFFYFSEEKCAGGMPVGVQGTAGVSVLGVQKAGILALLSMDLLRTGCSVVFIGEKLPPKAKQLEELNCFRPFKLYSIGDAKKFFASEEIRAFFSAATGPAQAQKETKLLGVKVFAPFLFA